MKRIKSLTNLLKIAAVCIIGMVIINVCIETDNMIALAVIIPTIVVVSVFYTLFKKLNTIIELLQKIVKDSEVSDETSD